MIVLINVRNSTIAMYAVFPRVSVRACVRAGGCAGVRACGRAGARARVRAGARARVRACARPTELASPLGQASADKRFSR